MQSVICIMYNKISLHDGQLTGEQVNEVKKLLVRFQEVLTDLPGETAVVKTFQMSQ